MKTVEIYEAIETAIARSDLKPGEKLPAIREAAVLWSANKNTVGVAYRKLQDAGLVVSSGRNGTVVAGPARIGLPAEAPIEAPRGTVLLHNGGPDRSLLPDEATLRRHLLKVDAGARTYGELGDSQALAAWADASFDADGVAAGRLLVGSGALDLLSWALRTSLKVGDYVGVEDPGYATSSTLVRSLGMRPVPIGLDAEGIVPESLRRAIARGCRMVVLSSRAQNPTGVCTSADRAAALAAIVATAHDTLFVDDDHSSVLELAPYHDFVSSSARKWMVIRSLSKFLGPDLRVAVCRGDDRTMGRIEGARSLAMGWVSLLLQDLAARLLRDRAVLALIRRAGKTYRDRYVAVQRSLAGLGLPTLGTAGLNIWIPLRDEAAVASRLLSVGWRVREGSDFVIGTSAGFRVTCASLDDRLRGAFIAALRGAMDEVQPHTA